MPEAKSKIPLTARANPFDDVARLLLSMSADGGSRHSAARAGTAAKSQNAPFARAQGLINERQILGKATYPAEVPN